MKTGSMKVKKVELRRGNGIDPMKCAIVPDNGRYSIPVIIITVM